MMSNDILSWVKIGNNLLFWRCPVHTPIIYRIWAIGTQWISRNRSAYARKKKNPLPSHEVLLVFHHQFQKLSLRPILLTTINVREIWCRSIGQPFVIPTWQIEIRPSQRIKGVHIQENRIRLFTGALFSRVSFQDTIPVENILPSMDFSTNEFWSTSLITPIFSYLFLRVKSVSKRAVEK